MRRNLVITIGSLALGAALAWPAAATPGRGNGNGNGDRGNGNGNGSEQNPDEPGRNGPPISAPGQSPGFTPPGLGGNAPPGHGGPNPGHGSGAGESRANKVPRGQARICEDGAVAVGPLGQSGASHVAHVDFAVAEASDSTSWARMMYFWIGSTFDFVLNAHDLEAGSEWTLVARAADESAICLADGTVNPGGQLHLRDSIELDSHLPDDLDPFEATPEGDDPAGASLELVPSADVDCDTGAAETDEADALSSEHDSRFVDVEEVICPE